jgi:FKBP-type peptidyl-prolyl cis-trans isomerase (trigger factor)
MKIDIEDIDSCRRRLDISAEAEEIAIDLDDVTEEFAKTSRVPGFRPGKAPLKMVERRYGAEIARQAEDRIVERLCRVAAKERGLKLAAVIDFSDVTIDRKTGASFSVVVDALPDFELPDYRKIPLIKDRTDETGLKDEISAFLLDKTSFDPPRSLVELELAQSEEKGEGEEEEAEKKAKERVRLMIMLRKIAGIEEIEVEENDLDNRIESMAGEYDLTPAQLRADLEEKGSLQRLGSFLLAEKTLDFLLDLNLGT